MFYAFRYALGRQTYAVSHVSDYIISHWDDIDIRTQVIIKGEIYQAVDRGEAGNQMDIDSWIRILAL